MTLNIILRTHSEKSVHDRIRVAPATKEEIVLKCASSLINSINLESEHAISLVVLDDHSSQSCIAGLKKIISGCKHNSKFISINGTGNSASLKACYEYARNNAQDIIYFVEDDYLHLPTCVPEMISAYELFKKNMGEREIAIMPNDDPDNYKPEWIRPSRIVLGKNRHFRTVADSFGTFMISRKTLVDFWDIFMQFADYEKDPIANNEANTLHKIWKKEVVLFSPLPSLAVHMQIAENIAPYIDWRKIWDNIKNLIF